jgi:hypothetical protein
MRYGIRLGCRFGQPHDFTQIKDAPSFVVERCQICGVRRKWNKGYKSRVDNVRYLKDHVRTYAQASGPTKIVFAKMYEKEKTIINI